MKNIWNKVVVMTLIIVAVIFLAYLGYEYSTSMVLDNLKVEKKIVENLKSATNKEVEYIKTVTKCEKDDYVAVLSVYTVDGAEKTSCFYFERNIFFRNRYEISGGVCDIDSGEIGYTCITGDKKNIIILGGTNLPDKAKKYSVNLIELDMEVIGNIDDNKLLELMIIDSEDSSNINCNVKLLDEKYSEVK